MGNSQSTSVKSWKDIHPELTNQLQWNWYNLGFSSEQTKEWIDAGLQQTDHFFANYLKNKGYTAKWCLNHGNLEELQKNYRDYLVSAKTLQEYLNKLLITQQEKSQLTEITIGRHDEFKSSLPLTREKAKWLAGEELDLSEYSNLKKVAIYGDYLKTPLNKLELGEKPKLTELVCSRNRLSFLDLTNCPNLKKLACWKNQLTELKLGKLEKLTDLGCSYNQLTELDLTDCVNLKNLYCDSKLSSNLDTTTLVNLKFISDWKNIHPDFTKDSGWIDTKTKQKLTYQELWENYWKITHEEAKEWLETDLRLVYSDQEIIKGWRTNNFAPQEVKKLTDIGFALYDWEFAKRWKKGSFNLEEIKDWTSAGLNLPEANFAHYLKQNNIQPSRLTADNLFQLRKEFYPGYPQAQSYLDKNYPCNCSKKIKKEYPFHEESCPRKKTKELDLRNLNLKGVLDLRGFRGSQDNYLKISLTGNPNLGEIKNKSFETIIIYQNPQEWLSQNYTDKEKERWIYLKDLDFEQPDELILDNYPNLEEIEGYNTSNLTKLTVNDCPKLETIKVRNLKDNQQMILGDLPGLKKLDCSNNKLTTLDLTSCFNLQAIICPNNQLAEVKLPDAKEKRLTELDLNDNKLTELDTSNHFNLKELKLSSNFLIKLDLSNNKKLERLDLNDNKFNQDLSTWSHLVNLKYLCLGNNKIKGSLESLKNMNRLESFNISDTDIDSGLEYLPDSLKNFDCSPNKKDARCQTLYNLFTNGQGIVETEYGLIKNFPQKLKEYKQNKQWENAGFSLEEIEQWISTGLSFNEYEFANYLKKKGYQPNTLDENYQAIKKKYDSLCWGCRQKKDQLCRTCNIKHSQIDELIQKKMVEDIDADKLLRWIPHEQFADIEEIGKGGFGKVYKARWNNNENWQNEWVALKILDNSQNITPKLLQEAIYLREIKNSNVVPCHGISRDSKTKNLIIVMKYAEGGNLRQYLQKKYSQLEFRDKMDQLYQIASGLNSIHKQELVHRDFHSGNILNKKNFFNTSCYITDLGLCRPVNKIDKGKIYGVPSYVAPEVLDKGIYTQASDVYSFGIVAYELLANAYPYPELDGLTLKICNGLRPNIDKVPMPQLLKDLVKSCWDADPAKRPTAHELSKILKAWEDEINDEDSDYEEESEVSRFTEQYQEIEEKYNTFSQNTSYKIHTSATITSELINTKSTKQSFRHSENSGLDINDHLFEDSLSKNWTNLHSNFTSALTQSWLNHHFTYSQTQDWINIGLTPQDYEFAHFLKNIKQKSPEETLNHHNLENLKTEFEQYRQNQMQTLQVQSTNFPQNNN